MTEDPPRPDRIAVDRIAVDWIAVDWGTTRCRAWAMRGTGRVVDDRRSQDGMGKLARDGFEPALLALLGDWLDGRAADTPLPVLCCGMVGARQGWVEAAYRAVPCAPLSADLTRVPTSDPRLDVRIVAGLRQDRPADVMRGEETQIAGFLSFNPGFDGVLCLPGTHTKWVHVSAGEVVGFQTAMTGDLFAAIAGHTVLRHSLGDEGWDDAAFLDAVSEALSRPETLAGRLFALRAEGLLHGLDVGVARARLSGTLIGAELAATRAFWLGREIALVGAASLCDHYETALVAQGVQPIRTNGDGLTRAGLIAARTGLMETTR